ncbi:MAG: hypothetical protein WBB45_08840 [Cyclobacteriaceae bacterium]
MRPLVQVFKESFVELLYEEDHNIIVANWMGYLKQEDIRLGCMALNEFIKKSRIKKHLSNQSQLKVLSRDVQSYIIHTWFPEVEKLGLQKIAIFASADIFARDSVDHVNMNVADGNLEIRTKYSMQQCMDWLIN